MYVLEVEVSKGTLYVAATPLGNLEDITYRCVRILGEADLVLAEDTRRTRNLLAHFGIKTKLSGYREQNHRKVLPQLLQMLEDGKSMVLVSDAGTPGVSDPGAMLVREAGLHGHRVVPLPGATAVAAALSVSGFSSDQFIFVGFLPARPKHRRDLLKRLTKEHRTMVFFEAPHRLAETLADMALILGARTGVVCREMTKINEEFTRGVLEQLAEWYSPDEKVKGEITIVIDRLDQEPELGLTREDILGLFQGDRRPVREIVMELGDVPGINRSELYRLVLEATGRKDS